MYNRPMASCEPMKFKRFSHKGYALLHAWARWCSSAL